MYNDINSVIFKIEYLCAIPIEQFQNRTLSQTRVLPLFVFLSYLDRYYRRVRIVLGYVSVRLCDDMQYRLR